MDGDGSGRASRERNVVRGKEAHSVSENYYLALSFTENKLHSTKPLSLNLQIFSLKPN